MSDGDAAEQATVRWERTIPIAHHMGVQVLEVRPGFAVTQVPLAGNTNHIGTMYAGVLFTVAELLGGVIANATFDAERFYPIVKDLQIRFRRPATTDIRAEALLDAAIVSAVTNTAAADGKADFTLTATLTDATGEVVATTQGDYQSRKRPSPDA